MSLSIWITHCFLLFYNNSWPWTYGLYISVILSAWVVISFADVKGNRLDVLLGDLSYPVYLFHTTVAAWMLFFFAPDRSLGFFIVSFILTVMVSWLVLKLVDAPLHKLKKGSKSEVLIRLIEDNFAIRIIKNSFSKCVVYYLKVKKYRKVLVSLIAILTLVMIGWQGYKVMTNNTLVVKNWGPRNSQVSTVPNIQADGNAGLWIVTSPTYGLGELDVLVNKQRLEKINVDTKLITASIPAMYFQEEGKLSITIEQVHTGKIFLVGIMEIK